jgi:hypothetical protein
MQSVTEHRELLKTQSDDVTLPLDWEKSFQTVLLQECCYVKNITGLTQDHLSALAVFKSHEMTKFDEHFGI